VIPLFVGYDARESVAYHTFCQSVLSQASEPVSFCPLSLNTLHDYTEKHVDGSNEFIYSRFLVPHLMGFKGWAIFADGDMVLDADIAELWAMRNYRYAAQVVKHNYKTKHPVKYLGARNDDYPCKNWSSVILWNCGHLANRVLTPDYVMKSAGSHLHRFEFAADSQVGDLPLEWNWLVSEYEDKPAKLYHYTIGSPCFRDFKDCQKADLWHRHHSMVNAVQDVTTHEETST
jgi:lipopolysaccharide biosynthesis glycosyltransferase